MRKPGWYWVRSGADEAWEVGEWNGGTWELTGTDHDWPEYMIKVVGPRIPTPDEPWQCVPVEPVGWQFYQDGKWWHGDDRIKDHRKNTEAAGYPVRDVYAAPQPAPKPETQS